MTTTLRGYGRFVVVAFRASPWLTWVTAAAAAVASVAPLAAAAAVGAVVARVPEIAGQGLDSAAGRSALWWTVAVSVLFLVQFAIMAARTATSAALGDRVDLMLQRDLMAAVMEAPGIAHLEDHATLNLVNVGRETFRQFQKPGRLAANLTSLVSLRVTFVGACVVLARFQPLAAVALVAAGLWATYEASGAKRVEASHHYGGSELSRRTDYYSELGVTPPAAKEIRVFGLPQFLLERFSRTWNEAMLQVLAPAGVRPLVSSTVLAGVAIGTFVWVCLSAAADDIGIGAATAFAQTILVGLGAVNAASYAAISCELSLSTLLRFEEAAAAVAPPAATASRDRLLPAAGLPRAEIRFENVRFRYPGADHDVLRGLNLTVPAGRSMAIVGANGAGKTTVIKLLARLHEPTAGRVTADGVDLRDLDAHEWRQRLAAVFQGSVRYHLPAKTNIGFGYVSDQDNLEAVEVAAASAGVADTLRGLPRGWDTVLSTDYAGGADLSGGEWQKVGLARALFAVRHGAGVLILDEPAAHLDARAEAQLYERFLALTADVTTIVISHRFSTVRQAASIVVLDDGVVAEHGTHDELLEANGRYAEMFRLQAARFSEAADELVGEP